MHAFHALAVFLPTDPDYAAFDWKRMRGLNALHLALVGLLGLLWDMENIGLVLAGNDPEATFWMIAADLFWQPVILMVTFMPMLVFVTIANNLAASWHPVPRVALLAAAMLLGAFVHAISWLPIGCMRGLDGGSPADCLALTFSWGKLASFTRAALWGALITALLHYDRRERDAARALHETHLQRMNAERQETEARLRALQAQIEPHFLFNTLAHIQRLHQVDQRLGRSMLRSLIDYLRSALPQMREPESTLGRELALARAYLNVQQIRMGERLHVDVDAPPELAGARLPPMMLVTLVENAIKHGIGPKREGGTLHIRAGLVHGRLELVVSDDGVGLRIGAGSGRGLSNTRARLATLFGADGTLDIGNNQAGGVRVALTLPFMPVVREASAP